jgi:hypothetical protein
MQSVYVVGGHISNESGSKGNVFTVPSTKYAEFNMFLDPLAAKTVLEFTLDITPIPLCSQSKAASFQAIPQAQKHANHTLESSFVQHLFLLVHDLQQKHHLYHHMVNVYSFFYFIPTITLIWESQLKGGLAPCFVLAACMSVYLAGSCISSSLFMLSNLATK